LDTRNAAADHIGLVTVDRNVDHTRWPCISHPPELSCGDALRLYGKRGWQSLPAQKQIPQREWVDRR
jgi:hypothetical protein